MSGRDCLTAFPLSPASLGRGRLARTLAQWTAERRVARLWGEGRVALDRAAAKRSGWAGSTSSPRSGGDLAAAAALAAGDPPRRHHGRAAARHGRIESRPRGAGPRPSAAQPGAPRCTCSIPPTRRRCARFDGRVDLRSTLVLVASKSGSTLEPNVFLAYFFDRLDAGGRTRPRRAVTSWRSPIPARRCSRWPSATASAPSSSASRRSAGASRCCRPSALVPAALMGVDVGAPARRGRADGRRVPARGCGDATPAWRSAWSSARPRQSGRDKLTILASPGIARARRVARAAGRRVDGQERHRRDPGRPRADRRRRARMAAIACSSICAWRPRPTRTQDALRRAARSRPGSRSCGSTCATPYALGQEFFRWEIATAVAGAVLRHQPVRPAGRRGEQDRDEGADRALRAGRQPAGRGAGRARHGAWRIFTDEANVRARCGAGRDAGPRPSARAPAARRRRATTSRCSPTSR